MPDGALEGDPFQHRSEGGRRPAKRRVSWSAPRPRKAPTSIRPRSSTPAACWASACARIATHDGADGFLALPGDDVEISYPTAGQAAEGAQREVHGRRLLRKQDERVRLELRVRADPQAAGTARHDRSDDRHRQLQRRFRSSSSRASICDMVRDLLRASFPAADLSRSAPGATSKAPLLAAVQMETAMLNVLLFMIIAVAGFGILAIFFMIVVEKTRDIGILKSLGATGRGIMGIFLGYGLSLGIVGAGVGLVIGPVVRALHQRDRRRARPASPASRCSIRRSTTSRRFRRSSKPFTVAWIVVGRDGDRRAGQHLARAARRATASGGGTSL